MRFQKISAPLPRIGILGASRIVRKALLAEAFGLVDVAAIAARDLSRAQAFARENGIPKAYGSYQELVFDPTLDLVYNALPASGHVPWSIAALRAKKHVLCEKPFGLDHKEVETCVAIADEESRLVMEAHHWRYHPLVAPAETALRDLSASHESFDIEACFVGGLNNPGDIRFNPLLGPGVLMDFGCYTIQWCDWAGACLLSMQPLTQSGNARIGAAQTRVSVIESQIVSGKPGIDLAAQVRMRIEPLHASSRRATVSARFLCDLRNDIPFRAFVRVTSGNDFVHFENPLNVQGSHLIACKKGKETRVDPNGPTTYGGQLRAFLHALRTGEPPLTSGESIVRTQALLDDCYRVGGGVTRKELREQSLVGRPPG